MKRLVYHALATITLIAGCTNTAPPATPPKPEIKTCTVTTQNVRATIEATGTVQPDLDGGAKIVSPLAGVVERILVKVGTPVKKGTPLIVIRSSDMSDASSASLAAEAQLKQAERSYNLNKKLHDIGAVTQNDLLTSEGNYEQSKAVAEGLRKKLEIYGASGNSGHLVIKAPLTGTVVDVPAHLGNRCDASTPLMSVANPGKSVIVANIFDTAIDGLRKGKEVEFTTDILPGTFKGVVTYVSDVEDPDSKTIKSYIKPLSSMEKFRQNMFLKIKILQDEKPAPVVAKSSVIYKEGKFYVQLKKNGTFEMKQIVPLRDVTDKLMAVDGIAAGDVIACSAIDMEQP